MYKWTYFSIHLESFKIFESFLRCTYESPYFLPWPIDFNQNQCFSYYFLKTNWNTLILFKKLVGWSSKKIVGIHALPVTFNDKQFRQENRLRRNNKKHVHTLPTTLECSPQLFASSQNRLTPPTNGPTFKINKTFHHLQTT